jgi:tyrosyl-tRNA synthetase
VLTHLARSVQSRLTSAGGMSFAEFSYQLLQAQDFAHLHAACGCTLQVGGSDQFGNIVAGLDLIHRRGGGPAFGLTTPLLTTAAGAKIGKSAGNALWLDPRQTGAYDFWQFWLRTADADVGRFLRMFTLLPLPDIAALEKEHAAAPDRRLARRRLADEVTRLVHGGACPPSGLACPGPC